MVSPEVRPNKQKPLLSMISIDININEASWNMVNAALWHGLRILDFTKRFFA